MGTIPTGTVTFLFTDIEKSTVYAREYPQAWEVSQARHHAILRKSVETNGGYLFQTIGDAVCAAFHNPDDAIKAALDGQAGLQNEEWGDFTVRVRMGVHSGHAEFNEGDYHGYLTLSLVQRIMSAGHGGQVLLSGATENLLRGQLSQGIELVDMGRHTFKDAPQAVRIFQVFAPGLQVEFPPLRAFDILPNNLPAQLTSFIGREKELGDVRQLLRDTHMLTLIGPGGTGKTRLSIQAANEVLKDYPDGVWLVDLAPILDPHLVPRTTAITIGLRNEPQRPVIDMICDYLNRKKMLLILDNCEHLVDACAQMADRILRAGSDVQILASSREALGIAGEVTYRVPSLGLPDVDHLPSLDSLSQYEAVKLFIDRGTSIDPGFKVTNENAPALAQICYRLDGIPLAIELAAAKIRVLSVEQIANRLDDRFRLLTGGRRTAMERHQTLRAAVDWSYNLLPPDEQALFRRLAVFLGGWTLEAAEAICGDESDLGVVASDDVLELLEGLINKSLVIAESEHGMSRYHMLETIRQYANEKLVDSGEAKGLHEEHLEFFLDLAETASLHLYRHEQLEWLGKLDADYENLRAALEFALGKESAELSLRLCAALGMFWSIRGYWKEGAAWLAGALEKPVDEADQEERTARVRALNQDAVLSEQLDDLERLHKSAELSISLAQQDSEKLDISIGRFHLGHSYSRLNDKDTALPLMEQSFNEIRDLNTPYWEAHISRYLGFNLQYQGKLKEDEWRLRNLELAREAGERQLLATLLYDLSDTFYRSSRLDESLKYAQEADILFKQVGSIFNLTPFTFANIAWLEGDLDRAEALYVEMREQLGLLGEKNIGIMATGSLGMLAQERGNLDQARIYFEECLEVSRELNRLETIAFSLVSLSNPDFLGGDKEKCRRYLFEAVHLVKPLTELPKMYFLIYGLFSLHLISPKRTATILGALDYAEKNEVLTIPPLERHACDRTEEHLREMLGNATFESAFTKGSQMSINDTLDLVLKIAEEI